MDKLAEKVVESVEKLVKSPGAWREKLAALRMADSEGVLEELEAWFAN